MMEFVSCNCCGGSNHRLAYQQPDWKYFPKEIFNVVECVDCGLGFVNPRPDINDIARYYPPSFFLDFSEKDHTTRYATQARYLEHITRKLQSPRLLDVGCANGDFPRFMRSKGWEVEGLEVAQNSRPISDFKVYKQPFPEADVPSKYYDAITAWAVLEHVHDPMAYFQKAYHSLRPGGIFVFLVTNFESLASKRLFREDIPRHLYFFTPTTLTMYLERSNLQKKYIDFSDKVFSLHADYWLVYFFRNLFGRQFQHSDIPMTYKQTVAMFGWRKNLSSKIYYAAHHPVVILDRLLRPIFDFAAIKTKRYSIMTCIAERA
ncbi:MAG: class I SAM-dependent methyltransferase [Gammaproteobacteria bacterium]